MGWIGGVIGMVVGAKSAVRRSALSSDLTEAAKIGMPFIRGVGEDLKKWGQEDWDRFKQTYRPVAESLVDDANKAPEYLRYERDATVSAAQGSRQENDAILKNETKLGGGPASGRFRANMIAAAGNNAAKRGIGQTMGRLRAEQESTNKKLNVLDMGKTDPSSAIAGLGLVTKGGAEYGKYGAVIGRDANKALGQAGFGIGKMIGSYRGGGNYNSPDYNNSGAPDYVWGDRSGADNANSQNAEFGLADEFADGGVIRGPGTGRSDSIPAVIDGEVPARVSNGERLIPADIVANIGLDRLNELISISKGLDHAI